MMTTNQDVQSLEETLEKTDLGHIINENKKAVMMAGLVLIVGLLSYVVVNKVQADKQKELLNKAFNAEESVFTPFIEGKIEAAEFQSKLSGLDSELKEVSSIYPSFISALNKLNDNGSITAENVNMAQSWINALDKRSEIYLFSGMAVAALWEDQGDFDQALKIYEELKKRPGDLLKDRIFFNVGRMFAKKGDRAQAEKHFNFIFEEYEESEYADLARLYLSEI